MSDSDMDIDDDEVQQKVQVHTIEGESKLPIKAFDSQNDLDRHFVNGKFELYPLLNSYVHGNLTIPSDEQPKFIKEQALAEVKGSLSRFPAPGIMPKSFTPGFEGNEPEPKRAAILCKFFAKGHCIHGMFCRFLHVKDNSNHTSQQQAENNKAGSSDIHSEIQRRLSDSNEGVRVSQLSKNGEISLRTGEDMSFVNPPISQGVFSSMSYVNPPASQKVFPFKNELHYMSSSENMGRESLKQTCGADVTENRSLIINNRNTFTLRSSFVHDHRSSVSSGPAWTGSLFSSVPMNERASNLGQFENGNNIYGSGSLPTLKGTSISSDQDAEGNTTSNGKIVSSNDWEPSEPFKPSFTIPPYILPSSDALYDPFTDIENSEDRSLTAPSSKGEHARKNSRQQKAGDSGSGPQARESKNDDKSSSCSQNQHQETVVRKNLEAHVVMEGVATSVVDQNDTTTTTPSKEISSAAAAENRVVLKRSRPVGLDSWHRSDGSSYKKTLKSEEVDGEVRSDAATKVMRQFRTAVVETIKEMLKPLWREGRLSKDVHNMIVKKAAEKVVSGAVQFHQVPTDNVSIEQYLSMSGTKIVKLVEGYVEKHGKP